MGVEIEKKFLVKDDGWRGLGASSEIRQGFLSTDADRVVRVRVDQGRGFLTVKGRAEGARRVEVEVGIAETEALELLPLCKGSLVEKRRHRIEHAGFCWEVDEFSGENAGLVVAELEVADESAFGRALGAPPPWLGREVTGDGRLANASLAERPFSSWPAPEREALLRG